ncbi:hypothetical protein QVD17_36864 [Tagetes erecta]|uniref:Uncharacterized protein n=1 Tax=Tagetes erecta TaxID=13708 RepID=A0AAD8NHT6_TARER|nr:hypothetical protein QVD17_36864 [Tagetes erecta]
MGNCQAAASDSDAVVILLHQGNKIHRIYSSVTASHLMNANPGHYVAVLVNSDNGLPVKRLKLLRPDDSLLFGKVYKLISFQDILKEFAAKKKCVKLGKLLKEKGVVVLETKGVGRDPTKEPNASSIKSHIAQHGGNNSNRSRNRSRVRGRKHQQHQWKPALNSISENEH